MNGYGRAMSRYADFQGRASRSELWWFTGVLAAMAFVALLIDGAIAQETQKEAGGIFTVLVILAHALPSLAVTVRRLHDTDRSGWHVLLSYVPIANLFVLVLMFTSGTPGPNRFGPDPLAAPGEAVGGFEHASAGQVTSLPPTAPRRDAIAELERLGSLRRQGHLSDAEFEVMKAETLARGRGV